MHKLALKILNVERLQIFEIGRTKVDHLRCIITLMHSSHFFGICSLTEIKETCLRSTLTRELMTS